MFRYAVFIFYLTTSGIFACEDPARAFARHPVPLQDREAYLRMIDECIAQFLSEIPADRHPLALNHFLYFAVGGGDVSTTKTLIAQGADLSTLRDLPDLLLFSISDGHEDMVSFLLDLGASPNGTRGNQPLLMAVARGHARVARILLEAGATTQIPDTSSARISLTEMAFSAVGKSAADVLEVLFEFGENPAAHLSDGRPLIHFAARHGDFHAVNTLLEAGVSVNTEDQDGLSPLEAAADSEYGISALPALIKAGPSRLGEAVSRARFTPLNAAYLAAFANPTQQQDVLDRALVEFVQRRRSRAHFLLDAGADPNAFSGEDNVFNALLCAPEFGHILLDQGADPDLARINGQPPGWVEDCLAYNNDAAIHYVRRLGFLDE